MDLSGYDPMLMIYAEFNQISDADSLISFTTGRLPRNRIRMIPRRLSRLPQPTPNSRMIIDSDSKTEESAIPITLSPWQFRPVTRGRIQLLDPPSTAPTNYIARLWDMDRTITEWRQLIDTTSTSFESIVYGPDYRQQAAAVFESTQRQRWLARIVAQRWRTLVWRRRTVCNVDLIDMAPIPNDDAIFLTDTTHRQIYRFHRRDVFSNLLSNLCMSDEMLPYPRAPTNPWTNAPLTQTQTIGLCQQLVADFARRGRCPPVLFSAFWAARFDLRRFEHENATLLAQHAITAYFKDITDSNIGTVMETLNSLLSEAGCEYSPMAWRRFMRATPVTESQRAWLLFIRDYTMYMNLHVQIRPHWISRAHINTDLRRLYDRTEIPNVTSTRLRALRNNSNTLTEPLPSIFSMQSIALDISGNMPYDLAIQLIQSALFRM